MAAPIRRVNQHRPPAGGWPPLPKYEDAKRLKESGWTWREIGEKYKRHHIASLQRRYRREAIRRGDPWPWPAKKSGYHRVDAVNSKLVAAWLRDVCTRRGMQRAIAEISGVSESNISLIRRGISPYIKLETARALCDALELVDVEDTEDIA